MLCYLTKEEFLTMRPQVVLASLILALGLMVVLLLAPSSAAAAACVSEGSESWNGGFTCDGVPDQTPTGTDTVTVLSGHTITLHSGSGVSGALTVQTGATLALADYNSLTANGDVTVAGDLSGVNAYFYFYGATLTNTGSSISVDNVSFSATGTQFITGAGSWTGTGTLTIDSGSSTYLANDVTMAFSQYLVNGTFSLDDHVLTFNPAGALSFTNWYGTFAMGSQTLAFDAPGSATFNNYGTTSGGGTFETSGTVSLNAGSTLRRRCRSLRHDDRLWHDPKHDHRAGRRDAGHTSGKHSHRQQ